MLHYNELRNQIKKASRRSMSMIVSLVVEKYGPAIVKDPRAL